MFINENFVAILFRIINFAAIIGAAIFLFKKYLACDLLCMIAEQKSSQEHLYAQQLSLEKQQTNLDAFLKEEAVLCKDFRAKIDEWKRVTTQEHELAEKADQHNLIASKERTAYITVHREDKRIQTIVAQSVATKVEKSLAHHFNNRHTQDNYLNEIVHFMDERTS